MTGLSGDIPLLERYYNSAKVWLQASIVRTIVLISLTIGIPYVTSYTGLAGRCLRLGEAPFGLLLMIVRRVVKTASG